MIDDLQDALESVFAVNYFESSKIARRFPYFMSAFIAHRHVNR